MPRTAITPVTPQQGAQLGSVSAGDLDVTMTAVDVANGNDVSFAADRIMLVMWNSGASAYTVTITSIADANGRTGDITTYSLDADDVATAIFTRDGWQQTDGMLYIDASNAAVKVAALLL